MMVAEVVPLPLPGHYTADRKRKWEVHHVDTDTLVPSFCSIGTILPPRPAHSQGRRAQRRAASLTVASTAARLVASGCLAGTHQTWRKKRAHVQLKKLAHAHVSMGS